MDDLRWWWGDGFMTPVRRDPREDDPDYYKNWSGRWTKRTEWTVDNYESHSDWDTYCKYIQETTPAERAKLKHAYLTSKGLVQWARFPDTWTTPDRVKELEAQYQEGIKRNNQNMAKARAMRHYDDVAGRLWWPWC